MVEIRHSVFPSEVLPQQPRRALLFPDETQDCTFSIVFSPFKPGLGFTPVPPKSKPSLLLSSPPTLPYNNLRSPCSWSKYQRRLIRPLPTSVTINVERPPTITKLMAMAEVEADALNFPSSGRTPLVTSEQLWFPQPPRLKHHWRGYQRRAHRLPRRPSNQSLDFPSLYWRPVAPLFLQISDDLDRVWRHRLTAREEAPHHRGVSPTLFLL